MEKARKENRKKVRDLIAEVAFLKLSLNATSQEKDAAVKEIYRLRQNLEMILQESRTLRRIIATTRETCRLQIGQLTEALREARKWAIYYKDLCK